MAEQERLAPGIKRMSLDEIIEAMTADLENSNGHYVQFGGIGPRQQAPSHNWGGDYSMTQARHYHPGQSSTNPSGVRSIDPTSTSLYIHDLPTYEPAPATDPIYFSAQTASHLGIGENNNLIGTIDVGGGNYINVIYGNASQVMLSERCQQQQQQQQQQPQQQQLPSLSPYTTQNMINREYGLFNDQRVNRVPNDLPPENFNGKQLIDNLVGNWVPNQSGTYSPFGNSSNSVVSPGSPVNPVVAHATFEARESSDELPRSTMDFCHKKPRAIAEVKPMRPSYSDVLTKSAPTPSSSPVTVSFVKPKIESSNKKVSSKNAKNKGKPVSQLKRQNSSGSEDHAPNSPKMQMSRKMNIDRGNAIASNLPRRWVSLDNLGLQMESHSNDTFEKSSSSSSSSSAAATAAAMSATATADQFEKKKTLKASLKKGGERIEALNNAKLQNGNSKVAGHVPKRPIQINNNLNTTTSSSQTVSPEKMEKNQQAGNKFCKDDRKTCKEKGFKRFQAEKAQQIRKGQRNRRRDNRETPIKDLYKNINKYATRWSKIVLKIFYWLLHLISDVVGMSANLIVQLGKCVWYHTILYLKCSWSQVASAVSKIRVLNAIGKQLDNWFGKSKFAFWRKAKSTKNGEKEENTNWVRMGLETNIALPSTGEEAMKRLLACKGKDPYSILGVTPTCSDDDIKKYYKRQAFLVHPDKNNQPGAEEAFKILVHAFDIIGEPERRQAFDQTRQVEAAWGELSDLLSQLHRKMEQAANTIRCTNCGLRHKRVPTQRPCYAARFCAQCKIRHSAKEGDIWAESRLMGFLWHYYACMEGAVYDVTDWAACQSSNLKHLRANTHSVQYRIVLGQRPPSQTPNNNPKKRQQGDPNRASEAEFEDFLNNFYNHGKAGNCATSGDQNSFRGDCRRRKSRRKK